MGLLMGADFSVPRGQLGDFLQVLLFLLTGLARGGCTCAARIGSTRFG